jgi:hypothetical protein
VICRNEVMIVPQLTIAILRSYETSFSGAIHGPSSIFTKDAKKAGFNCDEGVFS